MPALASKCFHWLVFGHYLTSLSKVNGKIVKLHPLINGLTGTAGLAPSRRTLKINLPTN